MNIEERKEEEKIKEELASRIPELREVKRQKENEIIYARKYEIADNFTGSAKKYIKPNVV